MSASFSSWWKMIWFSTLVICILWCDNQKMRLYIYVFICLEYYSTYTWSITWSLFTDWRTTWYSFYVQDHLILIFQIGVSLHITTILMTRVSLLPFQIGVRITWYWIGDF
jgi:hypothetical protein